MTEPGASDAEIPDQLSLSVRHLNAGETDKAETLLQGVVAARQDIPQALMLMGVVRLNQGRHKEAEELLKKALAVSPGQPMVLFYLGHALRAMGDVSGAMAAYRDAIRKRPAFSDAEMALGDALLVSGKPEEAEAIYRALLQHDATHLPATVGLCAALNEQERHREAEQILSTIPTTAASTAQIAEIEDGLGVSKLRQRRFAEALPHFEQALVNRPDMLPAEKHRAIALEQLNRAERAASAYQRILAHDPLDLKTHLLLNELLHRSGRDAEMLQSYDRAARARPLSPILPTAKADQLMLLNRPSEAAEQYGRALLLDPNHAEAHIGLGRALVALGEPAPAVAAFETGLRACPGHADLETAFSYCLLKQGDFARAQGLAEQAIGTDPQSQSALAVLGLCYRANEDARDDLLHGYERFIGVFDLDPPPDRRQDFHHDLACHLDAMHKRGGEFFSQTLRGGTRASEEIFSYRDTLRDTLKQSISEALGRFIANLPEDGNHPFLMRRARQFRFSGSWSSRMKDGGFHLNHIHTGWISSVYYVEVPEVTGDSVAKQGWLKFGEPPADLDLRQPARRFVQPKPGRLVLFPSYMWHGTVPFHSDQTRTTIAFDALPH